MIRWLRSFLRNGGPLPPPRSPALPARDFFAWRRARAGVPDRPPRTPCGLLAPADAELGERLQTLEAVVAGAVILGGECNPLERRVAALEAAAHKTGAVADDVPQGLARVAERVTFLAECVWLMECAKDLDIELLREAGSDDWDAFARILASRAE